MSPRQDDEGDPEPLRPVLSPSFWAAMAVGLALVLAGAVVGLWGPKLFHAGRTPAAIPASPR